LSRAPTLEPTIGLAGATAIGVGATIGGGILALAGAAFAAAGPSAILAFALNGVIALLTVLSYSEMASKFPESGGVYLYSQKVLSIEASFGVGWVLWFASIVAGVLYAIGFAHFAMLLVAGVTTGLAGSAPGWMGYPATIKLLAAAGTVFLAAGLMRKSVGGGAIANVGKMIVFGVLILAGLFVTIRQPVADTSAALRPFFANGFSGLLLAMGYTFIAFQGFNLIAAVSGEIREPTRTVPRAMIMTLFIAVAVYVPLLFVVTAVGTAEGSSIVLMAEADPEGVVANAARVYLGGFGYWLVVLAAILSMFSALRANIFAASRIARRMALDRTLPAGLGIVNADRGTPTVAVAITGVVTLIILLVLPDIASAGAASSLITLIMFALAHAVAVLIRVRSTRRPPPFRTRAFPIVPLVGGLACLGLAIFQGVLVPSAGIITALWLGGGGMLFLGLFARRARVRGAFRQALDPELVTLRGRTPLVLVPVANPQNSMAMIALAQALVPGDVGRVLLQTVVDAPPGWDPGSHGESIDRAREVVGELLRASARLGVTAETLVTVSPQPMQEIARVATLHRCESVVIGMTDFGAQGRSERLESLLGSLDADVVVLRAHPAWQPDAAKRILVPVGGKRGHDHLRATLLGSLSRIAEREITFLRVMHPTTPEGEVRRARRLLQRIADDEVHDEHHIEVVLDEDVGGAIAQRAAECDLVILGVQRAGKRARLFGEFIPGLSRRVATPLIVMSRNG